jgi:hypothetical protein
MLGEQVVTPTRNWTLVTWPLAIFCTSWAIQVLSYNFYTPWTYIGLTLQYWNSGYPWSSWLGITFVHYQCCYPKLKRSHQPCGTGGFKIPYSQMMKVKIPPKIFSFVQTQHKAHCSQKNFSFFLNSKLIMRFDILTEGKQGASFQCHKLHLWSPLFSHQPLFWEFASLIVLPDECLQTWIPFIWSHLLSLCSQQDVRIITFSCDVLVF